jgi:hypothetical protein
MKNFLIYSRKLYFYPYKNKNKKGHKPTIQIDKPYIYIYIYIYLMLTKENVAGCASNPMRMLVTLWPQLSISLITSNKRAYPPPFPPFSWFGLAYFRKVIIYGFINLCFDVESYYFRVWSLWFLIGFVFLNLIVFLTYQRYLGEEERGQELFMSGKLFWTAFFW